MRHLTFMKSSHSQGSQTCKCIHIVQTLECAGCSTDRKLTEELLSDRCPADVES